MEFYDLIKEFIPLLCMPVIVRILSTVFKLIREIARGAYTADMAEELEKSKDQIEKEENRNYIDDDLKKYFNYKE